MTSNLPPWVAIRRGLTLLELTVVIATLLALVSVLFVGSRAWKRGSDRTCCILALRNMQIATRSYQNLYGYNYGGHPYADGGTQNIAQHLHSKGYIESSIYNQSRGVQKCPSGGNYDCPLPDIFPMEGQLYMQCSLAVTENHMPAKHAEW